MTHPVEDLPPSSKLAYKILEYEGELSVGEVADETLLDRDTASAALNRLHENGIVERRPDETDPRRINYRILHGNMPYTDGS